MTSHFELINRAAAIEAGERELVIEAPENTDSFIDMRGRKVVFNAPLYLTRYSGDFVIRCRVAPAFVGNYDAGGIMVVEHPRRWFKLAFENTDLGYPACVTVVTDGISDDANGEKIDGQAVWLQAARQGDCWCLSHSTDGQHWKMARYFPLRMKKVVRVGVFSQSPLGRGCRSVFHGLFIGENTYTDLRRSV